MNAAKRLALAFLISLAAALRAFALETPAPAALALGNIGAADVVSDPRRALRDGSEDVRHSAKLALASLR